MTFSRTLLATAVLVAVSAPVLAQQSSVNLYGNLDVGLLNMNNLSAGKAGYVPSPANAGSRTQVKDGGIGASNWGIRGREDLGGGLAATFQLQGNLNLKDGGTGGPNSTASTSFFNQVAALGIVGGFGEFKIGRQVAPVYFSMSSTDARGARYFGSALTGLVAINSASGSWVGNSSNVAFGTIYNDNALSYTSPKFGDVTVSAIYALGETTGGMKANSQQSISALYDANGLKISALYYNGYGNGLGNATLLSGSATAAAAAGFSTTANTNRLAMIGALYNWGAYTVGAQYFAARNPAHAILPGGSDSLDMWNLSAGWRVAPTLNVTTSYLELKDNKNSGHKASQFALGADYVLSKRTIAYAQAAVVTNKGANMNLSPVYASPVAANQDVRAYMVGVRHSF